MKITGLYNKDANFTTVCSNGTITTIARSTGEWGQVAIGQKTAFGPVLTESLYNKILSDCNKSGEFILN